MAKRFVVRLPGAIALSICYFASACAVHAATVTLNPVADTFVSAAHPTSSYGTAGTWEVSAAGLTNGEFQSLLQFNLSSAKANFDATYGAGDWTLQSASLQLTASANANPTFFNNPAAGEFDISWMQNDTWVEGTGTPMAPGTNGITWNTLPNYLSAGDQPLGAFSYDGTAPENVSLTLSVPTGFLSDLGSGDTKSSMRIYPTDSAISGLFNSENFMLAADRPVLSLTAVAAVPEPANWVLGLFGGAALALLRRRLNDGSGGPRGRC